MKALGFLVYFFGISLSIAAQSIDLRTLSTTNRNSYLINLAKEVTETFGPGWYQGAIVAQVSDSVKEFKDEFDLRPEIQKNVGRKYYTVTFLYDDATKKKVKWSKASIVTIWEDDGTPMEVIFGNKEGRNFFFLSYNQWVRAGLLKGDKKPFEEMKLPSWVNEK